MVAVVLLVGAWGLGDVPRPASAQIDWCDELQQEIDALNRGEIDLENYADDMVFAASPICDDVECLGKDAYRNYLQHYIDLNRQLTITSCEISANTIATTAEMAYDASRAAGVDRLIGGATYEVQDDKIVAVRYIPPDMTDPQTAQFVAYWLARPKPAFEMGPGRDADQSPGMAEMHGYPGFVIVFARIAPGPTGVPQPIHIHEGSCANLGPVAFALRPVDGGVSHAVLRNVSLGDLQTGNFAIAVQQSEDEPDVYAACGDIPAAAEEEAPAEAPPAEEAPVIAPPPVVAPPAAGSGGLLAEDGSGIPNWWYALAAGGALLVMVALAGLAKARRRR